MSSESDFLQGIIEKRAITDKKKVLAVLSGPIPGSLANTNLRSIPNNALRTSLFRSSLSKEIYVRRTKISSINGINLFYQGPGLSQHHLDIWERCIYLARNSGTNIPIEFTAYSLLKSIGRSTGKTDREWLRACILDLTSAVIDVGDGNFNYAGSLINEFYMDENEGRWVISINPKISFLFMDKGYTNISWEERYSLKRQPLAQWIHAFYSSQTNESCEKYVHKVESIMNLCGSTNKSKDSFRQALKRALESVATVTGWTLYIDNNDFVIVDKKKSKDFSLG